MLVYGTDLFVGYRNSRNPWGCYKKKIKTMIFNNDKVGKIKIEDNCCKTGNNYKLAIYASKPIEEIMNNRIKKLSGNLLWDWREDGKSSGFNINKIIINRGVEEFENVFSSNQEVIDRDIYIDKYVKTIDANNIFQTDRNNPAKTTLHVKVSPEDYINNNYCYKVIGNTDQDILDGDSFITNPEFTSNDYSGEVVNDIDDTYVNIGDRSAPDTIQVDGKTYYKYDTYITNSNREIDISLPIDDSLDYYVKEIKSPNRCSLKDVAMRIDMSNPIIDLRIKHDEAKEDISNNPQTSFNIIIVGTILLLTTGFMIFKLKKII